MAIPVEKLNMMLEELMKKSQESAKAMNIISLEDYKKLNANKVAYLNFLKDFISVFNKDTIELLDKPKVLASLKKEDLENVVDKLQGYFKAPAAG